MRKNIDEIKIKPSQTTAKIKLPNGNIINIGPKAVALVNGKSDAKVIIREMKAYIKKDIFKDIPNERYEAESK